MKKYLRTEIITEDEFITATGFDAGDCGEVNVISDGVAYTAVNCDRHTIAIPINSVE